MCVRALRVCERVCDAELKEPSAYKDVFFLWFGLEKKSSNMCVSVLQRVGERERVKLRVGVSALN